MGEESEGRSKERERDIFDAIVGQPVLVMVGMRKIEKFLETL